MPVQRLKVAILPLDLTLLWARNPFTENFNHWQVSRKEDGRETGMGQQVAQLHDRYIMMMTWQCTKYELPEDGTVMSKHVGGV